MADLVCYICLHVATLTVEPETSSAANGGQYNVSMCNGGQYNVCMCNQGLGKSSNSNSTGCLRRRLTRELMISISEATLNAKSRWLMSEPTDGCG